MDEEHDSHLVAKKLVSRPKEMGGSALVGFS